MFVLRLSYYLSFIQSLYPSSGLPPGPPRSPRTGQRCPKQRKTDLGIAAGYPEASDQEEKSQLQRKPKNCRICTRSNLDIDPTNDEEPVAWGYQNQQKIKDGLVYVQGKVDWYCEKTMYLDHRGKTVEEVANAYADADGKFKENFELTRDATIATAMALGRSEVKKKQVNKFKESIIQDTVSMTERAREFTEYRKDVFEREFKNQPEVLKKAKFENVRVRAAKGGWKVEQRVRVYDQAEGIYRGKDADIESIRRQKVLDDGDFQLRADHAQAVQEEVLASAALSR